MKRYVFEKITPQAAVPILEKSGMKVTTEEAAEILELLYILAILEVDQAIKNHDSRFIHKS